MTSYDDPTVAGQGHVTRAVVYAPDGSAEVQNDYAYDPYGNAATVTLTVVGEAAPFVTRTDFDPQKRPATVTLPDESTVNSWVTPPAVRLWVRPQASGVAANTVWSPTVPSTG